MPVITTGFDLDPTDAAIKHLLGKRGERVLKSERNVLKYNQAKQELLELAQPAAAWRIFTVEGISHDKFILKGGFKIGGGSLVEIACGASEMVVGACTIGPAVETKAKAYTANGDLFHGYLLDAMASWAVSDIKQQVVLSIRHDHYGEMGYRTSFPIGPGEGDWPIGDQRVVFDLLASETMAIGLRLEPSLLMIPVKSITFLIGAGSIGIGRESGVPCEYCEKKDKCTHSKIK